MGLWAYHHCTRGEQKNMALCTSRLHGAAAPSRSAWRATSAIRFWLAGHAVRDGAALCGSYRMTVAVTLAVMVSLCCKATTPGSSCCAGVPVRLRGRFCFWSHCRGCVLSSPPLSVCPPSRGVSLPLSPTRVSVCCVRHTVASGASLAHHRSWLKFPSCLPQVSRGSDGDVRTTASPRRSARCIRSAREGIGAVVVFVFGSSSELR